MNTGHSLSFFDFSTVLAVSHPSASRYIVEMREKEVEGGRSMYKLGDTFQKDGFLELRQEGDLYLLSLGDLWKMTSWIPSFRLLMIYMRN